MKKKIKEKYRQTQIGMEETDLLEKKTLGEETMEVMINFKSRKSKKSLLLLKKKGLKEITKE